MFKNNYTTSLMFDGKITVPRLKKQTKKLSNKHVDNLQNENN